MYLDVQLLGELTVQRLRRLLTGLDLAPGELPQTARTALRATACREDETITDDDRAHDVDWWLRRHTAPSTGPGWLAHRMSEGRPTALKS